MSNHHDARAGHGVLKVDHVAEGIWDYRISDPTVSLDYRGQLDLSMCADTGVDAMCELISRMFTAAGLRRERLQGGPSSLLERRFPGYVLDWIDANEEALTAVESGLLCQPPDFSVVV